MLCINTRLYWPDWGRRSNWADWGRWSNWPNRSRWSNWPNRGRWSNWPNRGRWSNWPNWSRWSDWSNWPSRINCYFTESNGGCRYRCGYRRQYNIRRRNYCSDYRDENVNPIFDAGTIAPADLVEKEKPHHLQ